MSSESFRNIERRARRSWPKDRPLPRHGQITNTRQIYVGQVLHDFAKDGNGRFIKFLEYEVIKGPHCKVRGAGFYITVKAQVSGEEKIYDISLASTAVTANMDGSWNSRRILIDPLEQVKSNVVSLADWRARKICAASDIPNSNEV